MLRFIRQTARVRPTILSSSCITRQQHFLQTRKRILSTEATSKVTADTSKASTERAALSKGVSSIETGEVEPPRKKGFGFGKFILSITLLTGIAYSGSVYYSLKNENFRDAFIKYVYGAEKSVEHVEDLQRQGIFDGFEKNVKNFSNDTIKKGKDVVDKVIQTFKPTPTEESSIKTPQPSIETTKESAKDIEDPIILKLTNTLNELINILNINNVKDKNKDDLIKRAQEELQELETHIKLLKIEDQAKIQFLVDEQTKKYDQLYALKEKKVDEFLKMKERELKQQSEDEKHRLYEQHYEQLKNELARESAKHNEELKNELVRQAVEMQRRWIRDVKFMVEQERGSRLARLDRINYYFKVLERISVDNAEHLDNSLKAHRLWCALRSLQDAVEQPHRTPFANQITAMRHLSSTDEVVATVLSTIDDNVANNGIDSILDLSARFVVVREEVRRASLVPENGGVFAHLLSFIFSKILFRKHGLVKGNDVESILARVQYYLNENDLNTATRELNQLKGWPKKLAEDWIKAARNHLEIKQAIEVIETQATLSSLSVV